MGNRKGTTLVTVIYLTKGVPNDYSSSEAAIIS